MRPFRWQTAAFRGLVWVLLSAAAMRIARNPTPAWTELPLLLPMGLILTGLPGLPYVVFVRTWVGSIVGAVAFGWPLLALLASISTASRTTSTAGIGVILIPALVVPVVLVIACEHQRRDGEGQAVSAEI